MFQGFTLGFSGSALSVGIDAFNNFGSSLLFGVFIFVVFCIFYLLGSPLIHKGYGDYYQICEFLGSSIPIVVLLFMMYPSLSLLYQSGGTGVNSLLNIKVVGHQWYWSYEYSDYGDKLSFDSYMLSMDDLSLGDFRLLEVDNRCVIPSNTDVGFNITSDDVIHSWSLPGLGVKLDAVSGVVNHIVCNVPVVGVYYGQCSEVCGAYHSFMPIVLEVTLPDSFIAWVSSIL